MATRTVYRPVAVGDEYGALEVLAEGPRRRFPNGAVHRQWWCLCRRCGSKSLIDDRSLKIGQKACKCSRADIGERARKHGKSKKTKGMPPEYGVWMGMRGRCRNPRNPSFKDYGGRGIEVCARWDDFTAFYADMGPRPSPKHTIERKDNDGPYAPHNCVWATKATQAGNTRRNVPVVFQGEEMWLSEAARRAGVSLQTVHTRKQNGVPEERWFDPPQPGKHWGSRL